MRGKVARTLIVVSMVALLLGFLSFAFYHFNQQINDSIAKQAQNFLVESSNYSTNVVQIKLNEYEANTNAVAYLVAQLESTEEIVSLMATMAKDLNLPRLSFTYPDGSSYSSDGYRNNLGSRQYFKKALLGESVVSDVLISMFDGKEAFVIAVPVKKEETIIGVLHSTFSTHILHELISTNAYGEGASAYIAGDDGYMICRSMSTNKEFSNVFDYMHEQDVDIDDIVEIQHDLKLGRDGFVKYGKRNNEFYMSYQSMGINDWFIFHLIPSYLIDSQGNHLFMESIRLVVEVALAVLCIVSFFMYTLWKTRETIVNNKNELEFINSNIQGGLYKCGVMGSGYFDYVSEGFLRLVGYSREEMSNDLRNLFMSVVYDEDKIRVRQMRLEAYESHSSEPLTMEYRIQRKDGTVIWVLDKGQFLVDGDGIPWFYSIMLDHTQQKLMIEELHYNEQRYRIVAEQSSSIIFDYDYRSEVIDVASSFQMQFGYMLTPTNFPASEIASGHIHPDDMHLINNLFTSPLPSDPVKKAEIRLLKKDQDYIWCRFTVTTIFDQQGNASKGIGRIVNIDSQKKDIDELMRKAKMDDLTGLYNKATTQELIETILAASTKESHALLIIDIDDFKKVNDTRGHLVGDHVLADIGQILKGMSRATDIVGRMGGDEFIVFLRDITSKEIAIQKAKDICSHLELYQTFSIDMKNISCSIGIALAPTDATEYRELFTKADKALYKVKNSGKNRYYLYNDQIAQMNYVASRYASLYSSESETDHIEILKKEEEFDNKRFAE